MTYEVIGYTESNNILFKIEDEYIQMRPTLPKTDLWFALGIDARDINKMLRDAILNEAKKGGKYAWRYRNSKGEIVSSYSELGPNYERL